LSSEIVQESMWLSEVLLCSFLPKLQQACQTCSANSCQILYTLNIELCTFPTVLFIDLSFPSIPLDPSFDMGSVWYTLRGIIYHSSNHFTCRFISSQGQWWYHDSMTCGYYWIPDPTVLDHCDLVFAGPSKLKQWWQFMSDNRNTWNESIYYLSESTS
jgi:hypothetical protein